MCLTLQAVAIANMATQDETKNLVTGTTQASSDQIESIEKIKHSIDLVKFSIAEHLCRSRNPEVHIMLAYCKCLGVIDGQKHFGFKDLKLVQYSLISFDIWSVEIDLFVHWHILGFGMRPQLGFAHFPFKPCYFC